MRSFKKVFAVLAVFVFATSSNVQAQDYDLTTALGYLGYINDQYGEIMKEQWDYTKAISKGKSAKKVDKRRTELLTAIRAAKKRIFKLAPFEGDATFKGFVANHLNINEKLILEDYAKIVDMEAIAEQSYDLMEAYMMTKKQASQKLADAAEAMDEKMEEFASANNINLIESESKLSEKMRNAGEVYDYYNKLYLVFFKSYKQEVFFLDALQKGDVNAAEQNKNAMLEYSKEAKKQLGQSGVAAFRSDVTLSKACLELMKFYIDEAERKAPAVMDYYLKKESFEKIKANFDKIKPNKRTQADVDKYNKAVAEMNAAVNKSNQTNENLNKRRSQLIDEWNKAMEKFLKKHV